MERSDQPLFGREHELGALRASLDGAAGGRGGVVLLVGEPGIGKTRLASVFGDEAASRARVTWGRAWEAGGAPAYWPWIEALRPLVDVALPASEAQRARLVALARLLPELATLGPLPPPGDAAQERFRLGDALAAFLAHVAREQPLIIVLDDLHAADVGTLALLHFVSRGLQSARVLIVGTYRDVDARLASEAGEVLTRVAREARYCALGRLARAAIAEWVAAEGRGDVDALFAATEGNPLFVAEMLRMARDPSLDPGRLPDSVRDVIRARLTRLSAPSRALLDAASVLGRTIDVGLAASLAGLSLAEARDLAGEASRADVLVDTRDRTAFAHVLFREVLYHELAASRRAELHAMVGRALALRDGAREDVSLAEAAHHLFAAVPTVPVDEAITWARRAAARAVKRLAYDEACELVARALAQLPHERDAERCDLLLELAAAQGAAGRATLGRETAVAAAALARTLRDPERLAHAALRCGAAFLVAVVDGVLVGLLEEALAALPPGDHPLRARLLGRLAAATQPAPDPDGPIALAHEALAMVRRVGSESERLEVLVSATSALLYFADPRERLPLDSELVTLAERAGDRVAVVRGLLRLAFDHLELGDGASADHTIGEYDRLSKALGLPMLRWRAPMLRAMRALMDGRFAESEALCAEAAAIAAQVDDAAAKGTLAVHTTARLWASGRIDALAAHLPTAFDILGRMVDPLFARTFKVGMLTRSGRAADARVDLDALVRHEPPLRGRPMMVWAAEAALALGDSAAASALIRLLEPIAQRRYSWSPLGMVMEGPIADVVARLHALTRSPAPVAPTRHFTLTQEGDVWTIRADTTFRLRDSRGLQMLAQLVAHPGRDIHVTELTAQASEDAGDALDRGAIDAYKRRLEDLRETEAEASAHNDGERAAKARDEIQAIAAELARGVGLGGRARKAASTAEKARVNVKQRLDDAIARIDMHSKALAKHLRQTIRTGTFCCYDP